MVESKSRLLRLSFAILAVSVASLARSGEMAQFAAAGIPALDRPWAAVEYNATADVLAARKIPLPTAATVDGAAFVKRLTAAENLAVHQKRTLPLETRLRDVAILGIATSKILSLYATAGRSEPVRDAYYRLYAFSLQANAVMADLAAQYLPTIPHDDQYDSRVAAFQKVRSAAGHLFEGTALLVTDPDIAPVNLSRLLAALAVTVPKLKTLVPSDVRADFRRKVEGLGPRLQGEDLTRAGTIIVELQR